MCGADVFTGREAEGRCGGGGSGRGDVAGDGGNLCEGEVAACEDDRCT